MARARCIAVVGPGCRSALRSALAVAILTGATLARGVSGPGDAPEIHLPDGGRPPVLDTFELPEAVQALAVSPDGRRAAVAVPVEGKGRAPRASIRVHAVGRDEPVTVPVQGIVRDLLFLEDGAALYAIEHRPAKRREGDSYLVRIDEGSAKAPRVMRLPPSARDLDYWAAGRSLLVAARNELRTITVPLMRSGPLFRVVGENLSVAVAGGSRVLVGQADALVLVDLDDPQERESMPVRDRIPSPAPVLSLALTADGSSGLAALADERVLAVELDPLAISDRGTGLVVDRRPAPAPASVAVIPAEPTPRPPEPSPPPVPDAAPPPSVTEAEPPPVVDTPPEAEPSLPEPSPPPVPEAPPPSPAPEAEPPSPVIEAQRPAPIEEPVADEPPPTVVEPERDHAVRLRGRIEGPAADQVRHVVVFGPDNLLREAARVRPAADGRYEVTNLTPGRYGIQLSGGSNRVLVTEPPFLTVEVSADGPAVADFRVLRAL